MPQLDNLIRLRNTFLPTQQASDIAAMTVKDVFLKCFVRIACLPGNAQHWDLKYED